MFLPFTTLHEVIALVDRTIDKRRTRAEMLLTEMSFRAHPALPAHGYLDQLERLLFYPAELGDGLIGSTWFGIWLDTLGRWHQTLSAAQGGASMLPPPLDLDALEDLAGRFTLREEAVPDFIRAVVPPSHSFRCPVRTGAPQRPGDRGWETALHTAIASADNKVPGLARVINRCITHFLILDDVAFRSCSADRYLGLVLLSTSDQSLIDIEESIIHELGHQVLYRIESDTPLFKSKDGEETLVLPWSGSKRNYFGFLHACYIYLILMEYYEKAVQMHPFDRDFCRERLAFIKSGLAGARPILLESADVLTRDGVALRDAMAGQMSDALVRGEVETA
ncbi:HEXXH motif-containing putative peptide modification protein [Hoeflea sp. YIM 152468]|uniref:aKG-HExxH-type peptide beta-hydroxylase n=1 Tax=Hoeflea sp. YIM 152468 TaxID=3031759 RepID=UPI0023DAA136|nr:HEXXH motif-containing putative peptide modification protein [Hoeflea sp. YIM 152468]MDF1607326.1 HEXXH motif-containing putative peptide modification protein [Hoeflea sp. YIM 152468]